MSDSGRNGGRTLDKRRLDFLGLGEVAFFPLLHDSPTNASVPAEIMQDERNIANLPFNNVTWVASHNAHANNFAAGASTLTDDLAPTYFLCSSNRRSQMATNQEFSIYKQLKEVGVRGLMLDIRRDVNGGVKLVHSLVEYSWLIDVIRHEIEAFLDEDPDAIVTIDLETLGDRVMLMKELRAVLQQTPGFTRRIFRMTDDRWGNHTEWPTVREMREADQRVVVLGDSEIIQSEELGIMLRSTVVMENHWGKGLNKCSPRNEYMEGLDVPWTTRNVWGKPWPRLFTLNHFCCATGVESLRSVQPKNIGGGSNGWGILYPRVMMCMDANGYGLKPNYIAVDWAHIGYVAQNRHATPGIVFQSSSNPAAASANNFFQIPTPCKSGTPTRSRTTSTSAAASGPASRAGRDWTAPPAPVTRPRSDATARRATPVATGDAGRKKRACRPKAERTCARTPGGKRSAPVRRTASRRGDAEVRRPWRSMGWCF
ncbi:hypothetical protein ACHAWF_007832 [Thalassiosira exigua]